MKRFYSQDLPSSPLPRKRSKHGHVSMNKPVVGVHRSISLEAVQSLFQLSKQPEMNNREDKLNNNNNNKSCGKVRRQVSFHPMATVFAISRISKDDAEKTWYKSEEYRQFDMNRRTTIAAIHWAIANDCCLDPNEYTVLGLEKHLSREQIQSRKWKQMRHTYNIMKQQYYNKCHQNAPTPPSPSHPPSKSLAVRESSHVNQQQGSYVPSKQLRHQPQSFVAPIRITIPMKLEQQHQGMFLTSLLSPPVK